MTIRDICGRHTARYVTHWWTLAKRYLKGWFAIDFLSTVPVDNIVSAIAPSENDAYLQSFRILRILRLARLLKLVRLLKLKKLLGNYADVVALPPLLSGFLKNLVGLLFLTHIYGCVW